MRYSDSGSPVGAKLGPKLARAMATAYLHVKRESGSHDAKVMAKALADAQVAVKRQLASHEAQVRVTAMNKVIDRAGHEIADLYRPIIRAALDDTEHDMHPLTRNFLEQAVSGEHQYKAISGLLMGGASGVLGTVIGNSLAPIAYALNKLSPNLNLDPNTAATAVATGIWDFGEGNLAAEEQGIGSGEFSTLVTLAQQWPSVVAIYDLLNRGIISGQQANLWLQRQGFPADVHANILTLRSQIVSIADAALAVLKGVIPLQQGQKIAAENGYSPADFNLIIGNTGEPPGTQDLLFAYRRNLINKTRLEHGIRQSRVRDEWIDVIESLRFVPMSTADAIDAAVQNHLTPDAAKKIAEQNGLEPSQFDTMLQTAGEPISRTEMMELWRRGEVDQAQVEQAIRESRVKDKYIHDVLKLKDGPITGIEAINARVQNHISDEEARDVWAQSGLQPRFYDIMLATAGSPLSLTEALTLHRRGEMTLDEVKQALRESRLKDKYIDRALLLSRKIPELFEIRQMLHAGSITDAEAARLLAEDGYDEKVIHAIIQASVKTVVAGSKHATVGVLDNLYIEHAISAAHYDESIIALGYDKHDAELMREMLDLRVEVKAKNEEIAAIRAAYVARRIGEQVAIEELDHLGMLTNQRDALLRSWEIERELKVRELTEAQIIAAWKLDLLDPADPKRNYQTARDKLIELGYGEADAKTLINIAAKAVVDESRLGSAQETTSGTP